MTAIVSLLVTMIPIDCNISIFSLHFLLIFGKNYNIGELTSTTSKERMTTNIISQVPHPLINEKLMLVSFVFVYAHPIVQHCRKRSISSCFYMEIRKIHS